MCNTVLSFNLTVTESMAQSRSVARACFWQGAFNGKNILLKRSHRVFLYPIAEQFALKISEP